jgi:hypothetical protein
MPWFDPQPEPKPEDEDAAPANPFRFWDRALGLAAGGAKKRSWKIPGAFGPRPSTGDLGRDLEAMRERIAGLEAARGRASAQGEPHEEFFANLSDVGIAGFNLLANREAPVAPVPPLVPQPEGFAPPAPAGAGALGLTTLIGDRETPPAPPMQPEGFAAPEAASPEPKSPATGYLARRLDSLGAVAKAPTPAPPPTAQHEGFAASAPPPEAPAPAPQPEGFAAPEPEKVSPFLWMLRVDQGVRGLGGDLRRRWSSKPLTAADADNPNAAAKSVGAAAENEFRVVAGAYRPHVPPGARAAYDRSTEETAASVNKQTSDAFRARAQAAHEDNARATFDATREHLVAAHDQAVRVGDHPRAETLAAQIADLDRFHRAYLRAAATDTTTNLAPAKPEESPARLEAPPAPGEAPVPASTVPVKTDPPPPAAPPALTSPEAEEQRRLETRIDQDAATLSRDFDPQSKEGEVSWKKRVYVLLHHVDHPAFDAIALKLGLDPARARLVAGLLTAAPADRERLDAALRAAVSDRAGNIRDFHFYTAYRAALDAVLRAVADPHRSAAAAADIRTGEVLLLLSKQGIGKDYADIMKRMILGHPFASMARQAFFGPPEYEGDDAAPGTGIEGSERGKRGDGSSRPSPMAAHDKSGPGKNFPHGAPPDLEKHKKRIAELRQQLHELHRTQAPKWQKIEVEDAIKHEQRQLVRIREQHSQRQKGPDTRGGGRR